MDPSSAWLNLLPQMRWFAGKGRSIAAVTLRAEPWRTGEGCWPAVREEHLQVSYADQTTDSYHLISAYRPHGVDGLTLATVEVPGLGTVALSDAAQDPEAFAAYAAALEFGEPLALWPRAQPLGVEQSNSSVRIAPNAVVKVIRRPQDGADREVRLLEQLSPSGVTPRFFGATWTPQGQLSAVAMEFVEAVGDGWQLATAACRSDADFNAPAAQLGRALRQVHQLLAVPRANDPGVINVAGSQISAQLIDRLHLTSAEVPVIAELADDLETAFAAIATLPVSVQQIHGDFHLGQALYRPDQGWTIIDFEGEPLASIEQRNRPDSPWRDVAGALRSFDYVRGAQPDPHSPAVRAWTVRTQAAFLDGYRGGDPLPESLLRAYVLDKAVYEVRYETNNRPEWVQIPLQTVHDELTGPLRRDDR